MKKLIFIIFLFLCSCSALETLNQELPFEEIGQTMEKSNIPIIAIIGTGITILGTLTKLYTNSRKNKKIAICLSEALEAGMGISKATEETLRKFINIKSKEHKVKKVLTKLHEKINK